MTEITVTKNDAGQRADRFLTKAYPNLSLPLICKLMRKKRIKLNGARTEPNVKLSEGDVFRFYLSDELLDTGGREKTADFREVPPEIDVIYEDENILLCDKPVGMVVHEDNDNTSDTLINRIKCCLWKQGEYDPDSEQSFVPALCNRIDRNTSGLVIAAKNAEALRDMNDTIRERGVKKLYLAACHGFFEKKQGKMTAFLEKNAAENKVRVREKAGRNTRTAELIYRVVSENRAKGLSLLEIELLTGRTHQIRAQMADSGHPLLGDGKYAVNKDDRRMGYSFQALCSYSLTFDAPRSSLEYLNGKTVTAEKPEFLKLFF